MQRPLLPLTARRPYDQPRALEQAGFDVIDEQQPSFLFEQSVLITGEVPHTTGYEPGLPPGKRGCTTAGYPTPRF